MRCEMVSSFRPPRARMGEVDCRASRQVCPERLHCLSQVGKLRRADRVVGTVGKQTIECPLAVARHEQREPHVRRRDAVEHHAADRRLVLLQVNERRARAVRPSPEVDGSISEELTHFVDVVHGDRGRVEAGIGVEFVEAGAEALDRVHLDRPEVLLVGRVGRAVERIGGAGPTLVHEHDVAVRLEAAEHRHAVLGEGRRAAARSAFEDEERIRFRITAQRRRDDDLQVDRPTGLRRSILEDPELAAERVGRTFGDRAGMQAIQRSLARSRVTRGEEQRQADERDAHRPYYTIAGAPGR